MEEWRSGKYTKEEMLERYRISERTFYTMIKKYADAREKDDYREESRAPKNPQRKFTDEEYEDVVKAFDCSMLVDTTVNVHQIQSCAKVLS